VVLLDRDVLLVYEHGKKYCPTRFLTESEILVSRKIASTHGLLSNLFPHPRKEIYCASFLEQQEPLHVARCVSAYKYPAAGRAPEVHALVAAPT
jgi:hypothetical protein